MINVDNKRKGAYQLVFLAVVLALTFLTSLMPAVFLLPLIVAAILSGKLHGTIASIMFGCVSLLYAFTMPTSIVALTFVQYPWLPIVPRLPIGIVCYFVYKSVSRLAAGAKRDFVREILPVSLGAGAAVLTNTVLVVGSMAIFYGGEVINDSALMLSFPYMLVMGAVEFAVSVTIAPAIVWALRKTPVFR